MYLTVAWLCVLRNHHWDVFLWKGKYYLYILLELADSFSSCSNSCWLILNESFCFDDSAYVSCLYFHWKVYYKQNYLLILDWFLFPVGRELTADPLPFQHLRIRKQRSAVESWLVSLRNWNTKISTDTQEFSVLHGTRFSLQKFPVIS